VFTGIVEEIGEIAGVRAEQGGRRFTVRCRTVAGDLETGASVALNGVCLTVEDLDARAGSFTAFAMGETLRATTAQSWKRGDGVNLERPLRASDRLGGHLVQGHVDGVGRIRRVAAEGAWRTIDLEVPRELRHLVAHKGSLAVDGVSLTVGRLTPVGCEVYLIPETLKRTTLGVRRGGDRVNLEADLLARYLHRFVESGALGPSSPGQSVG